jgi:hypothetical protein
MMVSFIDEHRALYGVEPICRVLPRGRAGRVPGNGAPDGDRGRCQRFLGASNFCRGDGASVFLGQASNFRPLWFRGDGASVFLGQASNFRPLWFAK